MPISARLKRLVALSFSLQSSMRDRFKRAGGSECSLPRLAVLKFIWERKEASMKDVAVFLGITPPSATALVDALVDESLVQRKPDPKDRRSVRLRLTAKGQRLLKSAFSRVTAHMTALFERLSTEEQEQLAGIFEKLLL